MKLLCEVRQHFKTINWIKWDQIKEYSSFGRGCHVADKLLVVCFQLTEVAAAFTNFHACKKTADTKGVLSRELEVSRLRGLSPLFSRSTQEKPFMRVQWFQGLDQENVWVLFEQESDSRVENHLF